MGAFFGSIVSWLLGFIFKKPAPASRLEVQTDRAAVAETKLQAKVQNDHAVEAAIAAVDAVRAEQLRAGPESDARKADRYSRD